MPNHNTAGSRSLPGVLFAVLIAVIGFTACSGGGGSSISANTTNTTYTITASTGAGGTVTPSGATTVTQGASQSYTITPNGGYAIATLVIDGSTVATSSTHTFTNVQADHAISATFSAAAPGGIVPSLVPARSSGVAPLAVFFDASATTDIGVTTRPFHDLEYTWSFGDPGSGTWASGAQPGVSSRNSATGPVAAHVFETPGTYTVTLTAFDGTNTATTNTTIAVQDPDAVFEGSNTICFSTSGAFTGCPAGATQTTTSNFVTAMAYQTTSKRLLFRRGETFTAASAAAITVTGPGIVGTFGTGAAPKVQMTGNTSILLLSSASTPGIKDWRIMDFEFDGLSKSASYGFQSGGGFDQLTILRMNVHDAHEGFAFASTTLDIANTAGPGGHTIYDQIAIIDSTFTPIVGDPTGWRIYATLNNSAILGNSLGHTADNTATGSHIVRIPQGYKLVISNNSFHRPVGLIIKMHGPIWCAIGSATGSNGRCTTESSGYLNSELPHGLGGSTGGYTELNVISDNKILAGSAAYLMHLGPQDAFNDERVRDVIVERNWYQANLSLTRSAIVIGGSEITARNNICDLTGGSAGRYCVNVKREGPSGSNSPAPPSDHVRIYNNTAYSGDASTNFAAALIESGVTTVTVQNNLAYAPFASNFALIDSSACGVACFSASNNSTDAQVKNISPLFTATPPVLITDWKPTAGSYATNTGTPVPVWSDFFRNSRPLNGVIDIGAVEGP